MWKQVLGGLVVVLLATNLTKTAPPTKSLAHGKRPSDLQLRAIVIGKSITLASLMFERQHRGYR